jgi:hypothetical protein
MRSITATARAMNDADLERKELELRQQIPAAQSLLDAIKRERRARKRKAKQQGER